jgi:UDP-N-acetylglucosamine 2-epimerase (non-hydrolysing)
MILICFGTRPEYIKVKSLIENLSNIKTCFTGQHKDLLTNVNVDFHLEFVENQSDNRLNNICIHILKNSFIFNEVDYVIVQGDTSTAFAVALSAFHYNKKVIHLEAGLRTHNTSDPFPEELNRQLITRIANIHLCPTFLNKSNLLKEGIEENCIYVVGNTGLDNITKDHCEYENIILVTLHRRNNIKIMDKWFNVIEKLANDNLDLTFVLPIHPNPMVQIHRNILKKVNVIDPLTHDETIHFIKKCKFIISDSGGIQEEASFLNKKIIICRVDTERPEVLEHHGILCNNPSELNNIFNIINYDYVVNKPCPFGDGESFKKIKSIIEKL